MSEATNNTTASRDALQVAAHAQVDNLFTAISLLRAVQALATPGAALTEVEAGDVRRLAGLAELEVSGVIAELSPHI